MGKEQSTRMFNEYDEATGRILWRNAAGQTIAVLDLSRIPAGNAADDRSLFDAMRDAGTMVTQATVHGLTQKVGDAAALGIVDGKRPTWQAKSNAMQGIIDALYAGTWNAKREAGSMLYTALQRLAARGSAKAAEYVASWVGMSDDEKARIGKFPTVIREIAEIRAERAEGMSDDEFADL